jgi:hypothetical protein
MKRKLKPDDYNINIYRLKPLNIKTPQHLAWKSRSWHGTGTKYGVKPVYVKPSSSWYFFFIHFSGF